MIELNVNNKFLWYFWSRVKLPINKNKCWIWIGPLDKDGYGLTRILDKNTNKPICIGSHRISFLMYYKNESLRRKDEIMHHCDNKLCINPFHLEKTTHKNNMEDLARKHYGRNIKISIKDILEIKRLLQNQEKRKNIAKRFNVTKSVIDQIATGKRYSYVQ